MQANKAKPDCGRQRFVRGTSSEAVDARTLAQRLRDLEAQIADYMEPERKAEIGARLKHARENSPYSQREFADAAGVELRTYQFWETGRGVTRKGLEGIARKLPGVDAEWIWNGGGDESQLDRIEQVLRELRAAQADDAARLAQLEAAVRELAARDRRHREGEQPF